MDDLSCLVVWRAMAPDSAQASDRDSKHETKLLWPPAGPDRAAPMPPGRVLPQRRSALTPSPPGWFEQFERAWLGLISPPIARRLELAEWVAETEDESCPRCGEPAGPFEADLDGCPACREHRLPWSRCVRLGAYRGELRTVIHELKFGRQRPIGTGLGRLLAGSIAVHLDRAGVDRMRVVIVPVPMSWRRRMSRGIDHTRVLTRAVGRELGCRVARVLRREHRPAQWSVPTSRRGANIAGAFRPARTPLPPCDLAIVVDDLRTTGATLRGACRALAAGHRRAALDEKTRHNRLAIWTAVVAVASERTSRHGPAERAPPVDAPSIEAGSHGAG